MDNSKSTEGKQNDRMFISKKGKTKYSKGKPILNCSHLIYGMFYMCPRIHTIFSNTNDVYNQSYNPLFHLHCIRCGKILKGNSKLRERIKTPGLQNGMLIAQYSQGFRIYASKVSCEILTSEITFYSIM